ncbi:MAG: sulfatase-like hydrolase/transferase [Verrucomicrobia bacterium]|nr:sulfatase-like hydrolase/transferase [Verrucomicrobiota bacterium]
MVGKNRYKKFQGSEKSRRHFLKPGITATEIIALAAASVTAQAALNTEISQSQALDSGSLTNSYIVAVEAGDAVVMTAASNKKHSIAPIAFTSTSGTFSNFNTIATDPYPAAYSAYLIVETGGTKEFKAIASGLLTATTDLRVLRADSGQILFLDSAEFVNDDANSMADQTLSYDWGGNAVTNAIAIEAISSRTSLINATGEKRLISTTTFSGTNLDSVYSFSAGDAGKMNSSGVGIAFAEANAPPAAPTFNSDPIVEMTAVQDYRYSSSIADNASDQNSDPMTFSKISGGPAWLNVSSNGLLSGTPGGGDVGTNNWTVSVTDNITGTNTATLSINVVSGLPTPQTSQTNIVLIVIDDLGWMDLSIQGSEFYETPRIDSLATNGMRFTQGYTAHPRCLPARYGLMTGRFPGASAVPANAPDLIDEEVTIGEALQAGGYATFFGGKWHISHETYLLPQNQGFDINITGGAPGAPPTYFYPYGNQPANELDGNGLFLDNTTPVGGMVTDRITGASYLRTYSAGESGEYITDRLTDEALDWMTWNADKPFFLYMSHYGVHTPYEAPADLVAKYEAKLATMDYGDLPEYINVGIGQQKMRQNHPTYAAMIESVDTNVGRLIDQIEALGISSNTVFIFTSDNGGLSNRGGYNTRELATSNYPLRTGKGWLYEGGIREALIVKGPGIPAMVNSNAVVNGTDIYPTILELTGQPLRPLDHRNGVSFAPALTGGAYDRGEPILWHSPLARPYSTGDFNSTALRDGDYKLIWWYDTPGRDGEFHYELYNVATDPGETTDLSLSMPAKAADLLAQIKAWHNHEHWERSVGVIKRTDADDVAMPPQAWVDDPTLPATLTNGTLSWGNYAGYSYKLWSRTNLLSGSWVAEADGLTINQMPLIMNTKEGFYKVESALEPSE